MASFNYTGRNISGSQVKGSIEAVNSSAVAEQLLRKSITPISIYESAKNQNESLGSKDVSEIFGFNRVSLDELIIFFSSNVCLDGVLVYLFYGAINGMAEASNSVILKKNITGCC